MSDFFYTYYKKYGNKILFRYKKNGDSYNKVIDFYKPKLWIPTTEESDTTDIHGNKVKPVNFESMKEAKNFGDQYKDVDNFEIHGNSDYANQFIIELFDGKEPPYDPSQIKIGLVDIEVHAEVFPEPHIADWPVNAITIYNTVEQSFYSFLLMNGNGQWDQSKSPDYIKELNVSAFHFDTEDDLLRSFLSHMSDHGYDIISGWNSEGFDIPYIVNRCMKLFGEAYTRKMLSPFGQLNRREIRGDFGKTQEKFEIVGLPHLDYMQLYKKHTYTPRESYGLNFISYAELGEKKISHEESDGLHDLYNTDFQVFVDYNIQDVNLMKRLEEKLGLFSLVYAMSYYTLSNFEDTMGTVKIWEQLIAKTLFNKNQVPAFRHMKKEERDFEGAYVREPVKGHHDWVVSLDLNSLYPHLIQQWNIGPETHIEQDDLPDELKDLREKYSIDDLLSKKVDLEFLKDYNMTMAANFEFYSIDRMSFLSDIMRSLYSQRKEFKKKMKQAEVKKLEVQKELKARGL